MSPGDGAGRSIPGMLLLTEFVTGLRAAGVPVSMVETIDAARALLHVDLGTRAQVRDALVATLIKSERHLDVFESLFEVYFSPGGASDGADEGTAQHGADLAAMEIFAGGGSGSEEEWLAEALFQALRDEDPGLTQAVVRQAVSALAGMEPGRPVGGAYYLYRTLRRLDIDLIRARLLAAAHLEGLSPLERRLALEEIDRRLAEFREALRTEIRRRLVGDRGREAVARTVLRPPVEEIDLTTATGEELAQMERIVHPLTRKLASRLARRRRQGRRGRPDFRSTFRRSLSTGGVPLDPRWRKPRPGRPEIVLLTDISGSVATFARFTMQMVYAMASQFSRVRSFAFIDSVDEVTGFFGPGVDFARALARIASEARVIRVDGHSDYGNVFAEFVQRHLDVVTPSTTVIVTGDARSNYHDPNAAALREIASRGRALYWLNPERHRYWGTGDSVMATYADLCDAVYEVRNLRQLEQFVEWVALPTRRVRPAA